VPEYDSNDEKSGTEVGSCVNGSRIKKAVPPPEDKILLEPLRGVLIRELCGGVQFRSSAAVVVGLIQVSVR